MILASLTLPLISKLSSTSPFLLKLSVISAIKTPFWILFWSKYSSEKLFFNLIKSIISFILLDFVDIYRFFIANSFLINAFKENKDLMLSISIFFFPNSIIGFKVFISIFNRFMFNLKKTSLIFILKFLSYSPIVFSIWLLKFFVYIPMNEK